MFGGQLTATMFRVSVREAGLCQRIKYILAACIIVSELVWLVELIGDEIRCQISAEIINVSIYGVGKWWDHGVGPCHWQPS